MKERINWIEHNSKRILYSDYSNLPKEQILKFFPIEWELLQKEAAKVGILANFENTTIDNDLMNEINKWGAKQKSKIDKTAVLGVTGLKKLLLNAYSSVTGINVRAFNTMQEAKSYLVN